MVQHISLIYLLLEKCNEIKQVLEAFICRRLVVVIRQTVDIGRTSSLGASAHRKVLVMDTRARERPLFVQRGKERREYEIESK